MQPEDERKIRRQATTEPQRAMMDYLDALLQDATVPVVEVPVAEPAVEPVTETVVEPVVGTPVETVIESPPQDVAAPVEAGPPEWAAERFEALLFEVAGLTLALPLGELGGIRPIKSEITGLLGQPDWFTGLLQTDLGKLSVVDTARWIMPERLPEAGPPPYRYVIRLQDSHWALACHRIADSVRLEPDAVKWSTGSSRRPWLAGTVKDHMCALLDSSAAVRLLDGLARTGGRGPAT